MGFHDFRVGRAKNGKGRYSAAHGFGAIPPLPQGIFFRHSQIPERAIRGIAGGASLHVSGVAQRDRGRCSATIAYLSALARRFRLHNR